MRAVVAAVVPTLLLVAGSFFACGGDNAGDAGDTGGGGKDVADTGPVDASFEAPVTEEAGPVACTIMTVLKDVKYDPVAYCVERAVLEAQHSFAFQPTVGTAASWNSQTLLPDPGDGGAGEVRDVRNDASYGSSLTTYYQWSQLYADAVSLDADGGTASSDLAALAPILEKELATLPSDYDGELYFNLRNVALGLKLLMLNEDSEKITVIATNYGKQIFSRFYFPLPLAGKSDAGAKEAGTSEGGVADGGPTDAGAADSGGGDPGASGDGILGVDQEPVTGSPGILYQPDKVATAAYALLDLATLNAGDPDAQVWVDAARRALDHIHARARDPQSGLYQAALTTTGSPGDTLADLTAPKDLLSSEVQATVILYLIRAQELVTAHTELASDGGPEAGDPLDAALSGALASLADFPFLTRADALIEGMDALWDGSAQLAFDAGHSGKHDAGPAGREGYMDGIVASSRALVTTKSTRPNAYMFAALHLQLWLEARAFEREHELNAERFLLANELPGAVVMDPGMNTGFTDVVSWAPGETAYFATVTQDFQLEPTSAGPTVQSYTAVAVAATIAAFNEQLVGFQAH